VKLLPDLVSRQRICPLPRAAQRDLDGQPDALGWCDCSAMSDASIDPQAAIAKDGSVAELVDYVDRDLDVRYRWFKADWLRVLPGDDEDEEAREQCERYTIAIAPATRT
jgi:hypothetical protein